MQPTDARILSPTRRRDWRFVYILTCVALALCAISFGPAAAPSGPAIEDHDQPRALVLRPTSLTHEELRQHSSHSSHRSHRSHSSSAGFA